MQFLIVVNCSAQKTVEPQTRLLARTLRRGALESVCSEWQTRLHEALERHTAGGLYAGRSFRHAVTAATRLSAELRIVSAGMGLLAVDTPVPSYSLTISGGSPDSILERGSSKTPFTAAEWWDSLVSGGERMSLRRLVCARPSALIVLALTQPYLRMLGPDLSRCSPEVLARVRIITSGTAPRLPLILQPLVMPYDDRVNDHGLSIKGTAFDYTGRALLHFTDLIGRTHAFGNAAIHARRVRQSLAHRTAPSRTIRQRIDDGSLQSVVRKLKRKHLSRTAALVHLRGVMSIACQEERFAREWGDS